MRRRRGGGRAAAAALAPVALLTSRWVERLLAGHDPPLSPAQYLALRAIAEGDVVGAELARRAAVSPAAVSQLLSGLVGSGLAERLPGPDRRRHSLALTGEGRRVLRSVDELLGARLSALLGDLPGPERDALARSLARLDQLLSGTTPPPRPPRPPRPRRPHARGPR